MLCCGINLFQNPWNLWPLFALDCVKDRHLPLRPTFVNLNKWPESEVVDRFSCRQMYLRSYKFSREKKVGVTHEGHGCHLCCVLNLSELSTLLCQVWCASWFLVQSHMVFTFYFLCSAALYCTMYYEVCVFFSLPPFSFFWKNKTREGMLKVEDMVYENFEQNYSNVTHTYMSHI